MTHGPHDFLPLEPLAPSPLALRGLVGLPPSHWLSQSPWGASPTHLGVQDPAPGVRGTERDWVWPGRSQGGDPCIRTWEDSTGGQSSDFQNSTCVQKAPTRCLFVCFPEGMNREGKPGIVAHPTGEWRGWSDGLQEPFQLDSQDSGEQRGCPRGAQESRLCRKATGWGVQELSSPRSLALLPSQAASVSSGTDSECVRVGGTLPEGRARSWRQQPWHRSRAHADWSQGLRPAGSTP